MTPHHTTPSYERAREYGAHTDTHWRFHLLLPLDGALVGISQFGNPSHSPIGKHFPNSKYENVKNKQIQISIFAPAGTKILDLFDSEHFWSPGNPC